MRELQIINEQEVLGKRFRIYGDFENPLFLAKDVAEWIEYGKTSQGFYDTSAMLRIIEEPEKIKVRTTINNPSGSEAWFLSEDGLYEVLMQSRKPIAKEFKKEVKQILKTIRKHGAYATEDILEKMLVDPDFGIKLFSQLKTEKEEKKRLEIENLQQSQVIGELKPKADYTDLILKSKALVTITQIAKDYGKSGNKMNKILHNLKIQYKQNGQWLLYVNHQAKGYTHSETIDFNHSDGRPDVRMITKWTQKGRLFLYGLLKNSNMLPLIERDDSVA